MPYSTLNERSQVHGSPDQAEGFVNDEEVCICSLFQARVYHLSQHRHVARADSDTSLACDGLCLPSDRISPLTWS